MRIFVIFIVSVGLAIALFIYQSRIRCSTNGLSKDAALAVASEKLFSLKKRYSNQLFVLVASQEIDGEWIFRYTGKDCIVDIVVDKCGVTDVGGLNQACIGEAVDRTAIKQKP